MVILIWKIRFFLNELTFLKGQTMTNNLLKRIKWTKQQHFTTRILQENCDTIDLFIIHRMKRTRQERSHLISKTWLNSSKDCKSLAKLCTLIQKIQFEVKLWIHLEIWGKRLKVKSQLTGIFLTKSWLIISKRSNQTGQQLYCKLLVISRILT